MAKVFGQDPPSDLIHIADESRPSLNRLSTASEEVESLPVTPTLPAFSQQQSASQRDTSEGSNDPTFTSDFRDRRRRAEKLSRFFGVAYQNIEYVAPSPLLPPPLMHAPLTAPLEGADSGMHVDVRVSGGRFWGFDHGGKTKEADMNDVMDKLRGLKAS
ncbi:hypothetical protein BDZ89DRAFT_165000 [Hymenopellis radicata]|nr:hypothetical protein BDZ89DRAFT_165000 [Hymenopellis radicata]